MGAGHGSAGGSACRDRRCRDRLRGERGQVLPLMAAVVVVAGALAIGVVHLADRGHRAGPGPERGGRVGAGRGRRRSCGRDRGRRGQRRDSSRRCGRSATTWWFVSASEGQRPGPGLDWCPTSSPAAPRAARVVRSRAPDPQLTRASGGLIAPRTRGWSRRLGPRVSRRSPRRSPPARRRGALAPQCLGGRARRLRVGPGPGGGSSGT